MQVSLYSLQLNEVAYMRRDGKPTIVSEIKALSSASKDASCEEFY